MQEVIHVVLQLLKLANLTSVSCVYDDTKFYGIYMFPCFSRVNS